MKKILIQLDSDKFPSAFDAIVAYDAGADAVQGYGGVTPADVRGLVLGSVFTRGIPDLKNLAVWIGGSDVDCCERIMEQVRQSFFGPFKISVMADPNGCNTTACTAIAKLARQTELPGKTALVIGPGPVGLRAAVLLAGEGCRTHLISIPPDLLGARYDRELAQRTLESARRAALKFQNESAPAHPGSLIVEDSTDMTFFRTILNNVEIVVAAGPAGLSILPSTVWVMRSKLKWLLDFNLTEPLGIEGIKPGDDFAEYDGKRALGALAIGNPKMKVHKECISRLFSQNDLVLDTDGIYGIARRLI